MKKLILVVLSVVAISFSHAQTFSGRVVDEENNPIVFANVVVLGADSLFLDGVVTYTLGHFAFSALPPKAAILKVTYIGYDDYFSPIPNGNDVGVIRLKENAVMLSDLVVKGNLPTTRMTDNALVTTVSNTVLAKAGTGNDVLSKLPLVTGRDGNFSVFGCGTPTIYINGKVVNNASELAQLSSQEIQSVAVITNPGADYSAETNAVIRIKTIPPQGEGISVLASNSTRIAHFAVNTDNVLLKYRNGGLEVFANGFFSGGKRKSHEINSMTTYDDEVFFQQLDSYTTKTTTEVSGKIGFNYQNDDKFSVGAYYKCGSDKVKPHGTTDTEIFSDEQFVQQLHLSQQGTELTQPQHEANVYYNGTLGNFSIDFNGDYVQTKKHSDNIQTETGLLLPEQTILTDATNRNKLWAQKLQLSYAWDNGSVDVGEEYTNSHISYQTDYEGADIDDGDTQIDENNIAAFINVSQRIGAVRLGAGVRFEHADYKYYTDNELNNDLSRTYNNCYPSLSLSTKIKNVGLSLNFTSRTRRPSYRQLDGTLHYVNNYSYQTGNPLLKPVSRYTIQLMAQWSRFFAQVAYKYEKNAIFYTTERYNNDPLIKLIIFENIHQYKQLQAALGCEYTIGCWTIQPTVGLFNSFYTAQFLGADKKLNKPFGFVSIDNSLSLPRQWTIDVDFEVQTAGNAQNCYLEATNCLNISIDKSLFNDAFEISLKANDIFDANNERITMYNGDIKVGANNYQESRNVVLSVRYTLNASRSKYKGTGAGNDEKQRL